jgi:hypothetical protein
MASIDTASQVDGVPLHVLEASNGRFQPKGVDATGTQGTADNDRDEVFLVTFGSGDPEDPKNWSIKAKWAITLALSAQGFNRIMISTVSIKCLRSNRWS